MRYEVRKSFTSRLVIYPGCSTSLIASPDSYEKGLTLIKSLVECGWDKAGLSLRCILDGEELENVLQAI